MSKRKCLVTGGAGFIGSHLVDALVSKGCDVAVIDNLSTGRMENLIDVENKIELIKRDVSERGDWEETFSEVDWVFHLAALADIVPSIKQPEDYFCANVTGTFNVLQASLKAKIRRFVYVASSSSYGIPEQYPTPETSKIDPQYPYALTKYLGEALVLHWAKVYNLAALSLRFFNVYGPRARTSGSYGAVFGVFLAQKLAGQPFTVVGDGEQTRDFTYISDIVSALICAAESGYSNRVYNVGSGQTVSVNRLVDLLGGEKVHIPKRPGEPDCTYADIRKVMQELNWSPNVSIEEGVNLLLDDLDAWGAAPVWNPESIAEATRDWFYFLDRQKDQ